MEPRSALGHVAIVCVLISAGAPAAQRRAPTLRDALRGVPDLDIFEQTFLDATIPEPAPGQRFVRVAMHITPSAERLFVFSRDFRLVGDLYGWALETLPNESIVYHRSQVHFAPTHNLEISVFDPNTKIDKPIYPPARPDPVRRDFVARVAEAYKARGEQWFRDNNHHMDATRFDSWLAGEITVNEPAGSMAFQVGFGDPNSARDPLPFSERVLVTCAPLVPVDRIECHEARAIQ